MSMLSHARTQGRGVSYRKIGLTTMDVTKDLHAGMPLVFISNKNSSAFGKVSILPEPGQPSAQMSQLKCPIACKKTQHAMGWW